jgi:hypothetical protein
MLGGAIFITGLNIYERVLSRNGGQKKQEPVFLNVYRAQKSIPRNEYSASLCSLAGRYDKLIPT